MRKYAQIVNNKVYGIFNYEKLPKFAPNIVMIDITDLPKEPPIGAKYENGKFITPPPPSFNELKEKLIQNINKAYDGKVKEIASKYPDTERDTWPIQQSEWAEWVKDPDNSKTPFVNTLAQARGITREEMFNRIGENVTLFAKLLGLKQQFLDKAQRAQTEEELKNIEQEIIDTYSKVTI